MSTDTTKRSLTRTSDSAGRRPDADHPFAAPWQAAAFALVIGLHEAGLFSWQDWAAMLARTLADDQNAGQLDGSDDYYAAWLTALERLLQDKDITADAEIASVVASWRKAYLDTPHGEPVQISR